MPQVNCVLHGDLPEAGTRCTFFVSHPLSPNEVAHRFPFEGSFHFRVKVAGAILGFKNTDYVWMDLNKISPEFLHMFDETAEIDVQALVVSLPEEVTSSEDFVGYLEEVNEELGQNVEDRPNRKPLRTQRKQRGTEKKGDLKSKIKQLKESETVQSVTQSATSFWNTMKATASTFLQTSAPLSDAAEENLSQLSDDLSCRYSDDEPRHLQLLSDLWEVIFSNKPFNRTSASWKEAGFQTPDPVSDLKLSGVLGLRCMSFMGSRLSSKTRDMLTRNKANIKANYPFAIVGINITLLLGELLSLRDHKYLSAQSGYWELFEDGNAFFELFCVCFLHIDSVWTNRKATRADFAKIIGETRALVTEALAQNPKSVMDFKYAAADSGMVVPDI